MSFKGRAGVGDEGGRGGIFRTLVCVVSGEGQVVRKKKRRKKSVEVVRRKGKKRVLGPTTYRYSYIPRFKRS